MRKSLLMLATLLIAATLLAGVVPGSVQRTRAQEMVCWNTIWQFTAGPAGFTGQIFYEDFYGVDPTAIDAGTRTLGPNQSAQVTWFALVPASWIGPGNILPRIEITVAGSLADDNLIYSGPGSGCETAGGGINDGRLCNWDHYAVYTTGDAIDVYGIWQRQGYFVLRVTQAELDEAPGIDGVNTLIKSSDDGLVQVYRLGTSDLLQVHAGLDFVRFTGLPASGVTCGNIDLP